VNTVLEAGTLMKCTLTVPTKAVNDPVMRYQVLQVPSIPVEVKYLENVVKQASKMQAETSDSFFAQLKDIVLPASVVQVESMKEIAKGVHCRNETALLSSEQDFQGEY
jgi:hypothetical protein